MKARPKTQPEINKFRRQTLIAATVKVVARHGVENTTIARICQAAGVSRGLAGHYFRDKEDLLCQTYQHLQQSQAERTAVAARAVKGGAVEKLKAIVQATFATEPNNREARTAFLAFFTLSITNPRITRITGDSYRLFYASVESLFARAAEEAGVRIDPHEAARALIGLIDGLWLEMAIQVPDVTSKAAVRALAQFIDAVLCTGVIMGNEGVSTAARLVSSSGKA